MTKHRPFHTLILLFLVAVQSTWAGGDAANGKQKVESCNACHGADGNSLIPSNPKLAGQGERYLFKQLKNVQTGEREIAVMVGLLDNYNDQDLADIAAYYASQKQTLSFVEEKWVNLGREIYRNGNLDRGIPSCTGCHGPSGTGNAPAGFPMLAGQHAEYLAMQLKNFSIGKRHNDGEGKVMRDIAERMNENEIQAVASYIAGLRP
ncbi:MAG: c-type cytochrome [Pseudomonadota bacterium]|nr:c-type cytochrome [Pseudomonadota bacterium]